MDSLYEIKVSAREITEEEESNKRSKQKSQHTERHANWRSRL